MTATFSAMLLTAKVFSKSEAKHERQPPEPRAQTDPTVQTEVAPTGIPALDRPLPVSTVSTLK
jgi:hypothetical protein